MWKIAVFSGLGFCRPMASLYIDWLERDSLFMECDVPKYMMIRFILSELIINHHLSVIHWYPHIWIVQTPIKNDYNQQPTGCFSSQPLLDISKEAAWPVRCGRPRPADGYAISLSGNIQAPQDVCGCHVLYPLVMTNTLLYTSLYNRCITIGFSYWKWWFSLAALN